MAQLLLISNKTAKPGVQEKGDVVGIFEDSHVFSGTEQEVFDIMQIPGFGKEELGQELDKLRPVVEPAWKSETTEWTMVEPQEKELWKNNSDEWCFLEDAHKYPFTARNMSGDIKDALADELGDKETKRTLIATHFEETISLNAENLNKVDKLIEG